MPYVYNADCYCDSCGRDIKRRLRAEGFKPSEDGDSEEWPQWYNGEDEETDCPQHCGSLDECLEAVELPDGQKIGASLGTQLSTYGVAYLREMLAERSNPAVSEYWRELFADYLTEPDEGDSDDDEPETDG